MFYLLGYDKAHLRSSTANIEAANLSDYISIQRKVLKPKRIIEQHLHVLTSLHGERLEVDSDVFHKQMEAFAKNINTDVWMITASMEGLKNLVYERLVKSNCLTENWKAVWSIIRFIMEVKLK